MLLLEDFYIIQSAEILHDYHNVPLKNASSMMTATRRDYIKCLSTSYVICRHVTIFSENFPNERRKLSQDLLINRILHILHNLLYDRRRKAYRLSQMIKRLFQHTAFFLWPVNSPTSSKDVHSGALYRNVNLQLHPTITLPVSKSLERPHSSS